MKEISRDNMHVKHKTQEQLADELIAMHRRIADFESLETEHKRSKKAIVKLGNANEILQAGINKHKKTNEELQRLYKLEKEQRVRPRRKSNQRPAACFELWSFGCVSDFDIRISSRRAGTAFR